jgi:hypothetical protein
MPSSPSKLNLSGYFNNRIVPDRLIQCAGHPQARKSGQLNRKKVVSPAQEQFFLSWCLILYARGEAGKAEIKPRVFEKGRVSDRINLASNLASMVQYAFPKGLLCSGKCF